MTLAHPGPQLADALTIVRLSLHVFAACVWVGGQVTLGGLVPTLRREAPQVLAGVARAFARLAWPAYALLILTGVWNVAAVHAGQASSAWTVVFALKMVLVAVALGERIAKNAPLALRASKSVMRRSLELTEDESWAVSDEAFGAIGRSADALEGAVAFAERREPNWQGR